MDSKPSDLDATRAAIFNRELTATASGYLTADVAMDIPFESLGAFKNLLKDFFSPMPWSAEHAQELSSLVSPHVQTGWWEHDLGGGITLAHGRRGADYLLWVGGIAEQVPSIFERAFEGPVVPEATPHPRKVKFVVGGDPAPGEWYRKSDPEPSHDARARRLLDLPDVTDVMVAGDFVTVGIAATSSWETRLEPLLALVTELFWRGEDTESPERTRDELMHEAGHLDVRATIEELHLLDPDTDDHRRRLLEALDADDPRVRRIAVAVLSESQSAAVRGEAIALGYADPSRTVRRTAIDAAADVGDETLRHFFEAALTSTDPWVRWRAVRALTELGIATSRGAIQEMEDDADFQVRFEVAAALRS